MRRTLISSLGVCVLAGLAFAGCGGDDDDGGSADASGKTISASDFADETCTVLANFADKAQKSVEDTNLEEALSGGGNVESVEELPGLIKGITAMFGDLDELFSELNRDLKGIGVPDVEGGEAFRTKLLTAIDKGGSLIGEASKALQETDPDSLADLSSLGPVFEDFEKAFDEVDIDFSEDAPEELSKAFDDSKTCKEAEEKYGEF
jgi:hypothetical protein